MVTNNKAAISNIVLRDAILKLLYYSTTTSTAKAEQSWNLTEKAKETEKSPSSSALILLLHPS